MESSNKAHIFIICLLLFIAILGVYGQIRHFEFIHYDDYLCIVENHQIHSGLTLRNIIWAFKTGYSANWYPVTWLTQLLDIQLYGLNAGGHHLTNLLIHTANTFLLFLVFVRMTGALGRSAFVAALFALHPLHVESVAQVVGRKDLMSTFFGLLAIWAYIGYVKQPQGPRYMAVLLFSGLSLMAKSMLVTLPFVLLLLDFWPLGRFQPTENGARRRAVFELFREKIPLFLLAVIASVVTFFVQQEGGAVSPLDIHPVSVRVGNAIISYVRYMVKTIWPVKLAAIYPHPGQWPWWQVVCAALLLVVISVLVIRAARSRPYLPVGWFWYLGTLVPVIGLVQVGSQAMADRYTYIPLTGLFIIAAWGATGLLKGRPIQKKVLPVAGVLTLAVLMTVTWVQAGYWRDSVSLFEQTLKMTEKNTAAHLSLGVALEARGRESEALKQYAEVLRLDPHNVSALNNLGAIYARGGNPSQAYVYFKRALEIDSNDAKVHFNLGNFYFQQGKWADAENHYLKAIELRPWFVEAYNNLGKLFAGQGKMDRALGYFSAGLDIKPNDAVIQKNLEQILMNQRGPIKDLE